ncbi:MAG: hypothetical protein AAGJ18_20365, partial [Bacteroidota bacterium]
MLRPKMPTIILFEKGKKNKNKMPMTKPTDVSQKDWDRYFDAKLEMDFRLASIEEMKLTAEEIEEFNPLFDWYVDQKDRIFQDKIELMEEYVEEMKEDDDMEEKTEETSDFIEEYWEEEIQEAKLRKDFYDRLENRIPYYKAVQFFLMEETLENRVKYETLLERMPNISVFDYDITGMETDKSDTKESTMNADSEDASMNNSEDADADDTSSNEKEMDTEASTMETTTGTNGTTANTDTKRYSNINSPAKPFSSEITTFDNWVKTTKGQMGLNHDYTSNGLKAVAAAIESTATASNATVEDWPTHKAKINEVAKMITVDPHANTHADGVAEAFTTIGKTIQSLNDQYQYSYADGQVSLVNYYANQIDPDVLLLQQKENVYGFFEAANGAIKEIWNYTVKETGKADMADTNKK